LIRFALTSWTTAEVIKGVILIRRTINMGEKHGFLVLWLDEIDGKGKL
jgi:hypothetical protein